MSLEEEWASAARPAGGAHRGKCRVCRRGPAAAGSRPPPLAWCGSPSPLMGLIIPPAAGQFYKEQLLLLLLFKLPRARERQAISHYRVLLLCRG